MQGFNIISQQYAVQCPWCGTSQEAAFIVLMLNVTRRSCSTCKSHATIRRYATLTHLYLQTVFASAWPPITAGILSSVSLHHRSCIRRRVCDNRRHLNRVIYYYLLFGNRWLQADKTMIIFLPVAICGATMSFVHRAGKKNNTDNTLIGREIDFTVIHELYQQY